MTIEYGTIIAYILGIILLFLLGRMFLVPLKIVLRLVYSTLLGGIALVVINLLGGFFSFHIPLNAVTALIVGFLGIPGIILLVILKFLFNG